MKVEIDGKEYMVKGPGLCHPEAGFFELMQVGRQFERDGKTYRHGIEMRRDPPDMTPEQAVHIAKPILDEWERGILEGKS